jgi:LPS-assembly lipoprotein
LLPEGIVKKSLFQAVLMTCAALMLNACGFALQGNHEYPFKRLYITGAPSEEMSTRLKRLIEAGSDTRVVKTAVGADAILSMSAGRGQNSLSFDINGVTQEYQLTDTISYSLSTPGGDVLIPASSISVNRAMSYSDQYANAKQNEADVLNRDMDSDIADQLLRRLQVVRSLTPEDTPDGTVPGIGTRAPLPTPPL